MFVKIDLVNQPMLVTGAARVLPADGNGVQLCRMTAALNDFYSYSEAARIRAFCTAGVRIAFSSTTPWVRLRIRYGRESRQLYKVDFVIDGHVSSLGPDAREEVATIKLEELEPKEKKLELYLPHCCEVIVETLEIADGSTLHPIPRKPRTWLGIGDSITQGMTARTPSRTFAVTTARSLGVELHNIGVGGGTMREEVGKLALELPWDFATVAFGVNDFSQDRPLEEVATQTRQMWENLTSRGGPIFLLTPIPWAKRTEPNKIGLSLADYRNTIAAAGRSFPAVTVVHGENLVPDDPQLFVDNIHPNDDGMAVYARNLQKALESRLR